MNAVQELAAAIRDALTIPTGMDPAEAHHLMTVRVTQVHGVMSALAEEGDAEGLLPHATGTIRILIADKEADR